MIAERHLYPDERKGTVQGGEARRKSIKIVWQNFVIWDKQCIFSTQSHDLLQRQSRRFGQQRPERHKRLRHEKNGITYLTTLDFLYYAYCRKKMTAEECKAFMEAVNKAGSRLPIIDISQYVCTVQI